MSKYNETKIREIVEKENIKYIRLMFTDMDGILKNVEIPVSKLDDALENKIMFDGSSIEGFARVFEADMYLHPDLDTFLIPETAYHNMALSDGPTIQRAEKIPYKRIARPMWPIDEFEELYYIDRT